MKTVYFMNSDHWFVSYIFIPFNTTFEDSCINDWFVRGYFFGLDGSKCYSWVDYRIKNIEYYSIIGEINDFRTTSR
jgi:hypothetical protein